MKVASVTAKAALIKWTWGMWDCGSGISSAATTVQMPCTLYRNGGGVEIIS